MMVVWLHSRLHPKHWETVANIPAASAAVRRYLEANDLGASDMREGFGDVWLDGRKVAHVSYNGRVWEVDGKTEVHLKGGSS